MAKSEKTFRVSRDNDAIVIDMPVKTNSDWEGWMLLNADRHWDNPGSDQAMMKRHLNQAGERGAPVIDVGDFYCAMQGKYDKRSDKSKVRPEHQSGDYLDRLVNTGSEFLRPHRDILAFMAPGNHEGAIHDRHETNLTERLVSDLRRCGSPVLRHRMSGFTRIRFFRNFDTPKEHFVGTLVMWHHHGYGGGGPVTKDIIQTNRQGNFLDGVDIVVSGHTHDAWIFPVATRRLSTRNQILRKERLHIKIPSAKELWGTDSWEDMKGHPPKPIGAYWLKFNYNHDQKDVVVDAVRAR